MKLYVTNLNKTMSQEVLFEYAYIWTGGIVHINIILCQSSMTQEVHKYTIEDKQMLLPTTDYPSCSPKENVSAS